MALSDTEGAVAWLDNFSSEDRKLASRLLDAFVLDPWTSARASLLELLRSEIDEERAAGTVWVLPAMDSGDIRKANRLPKLESLTAFENFEPGMDIPSMPGSEGLIGHLLRDVQRSGVLPPTAPIPVLRENRLRTIIVVSDTIETGGQVAKYVKALLRNPSIKSWRSFRWIRLTVLAFAVSAEGNRTIGSLPEVDSLRFVRHAPTVRDLPWTRVEIDAALDLCLRYGRGKDPLGYGNHAGLFGFQDRVPNTVPKIFRQHSANWTPLFTGHGGRSVPSGMVHELASGSGPPTAHDQVILAVRQERLAASLRKRSSCDDRTARRPATSVRGGYILCSPNQGAAIVRDPDEGRSPSLASKVANAGTQTQERTGHRRASTHLVEWWALVRQSTEAQYCEEKDEKPTTYAGAGTASTCRD